MKLPTALSSIAPRVLHLHRKLILMCKRMVKSIQEVNYE